MSYKPQVLAIADGGTGSTTSAGAKTSLGVGTIVTTFLTSSTWTINPNTKAVEFFVFSGGAGGGSGRSGVTALSGGGSGGAGANLVYMKSLPSNLLTSAYTVTVGAGGAGGAAATNANGNPGIQGGASSVGTLIIAPVSKFGAGGTTTLVSGNGSTSYTPYSTAASQSSGSGTITGSGGSAIPNIYGWGTPGGGGSGYNVGVNSAGGTGSSMISPTVATLIAGGTAGSSAGGAGGAGNAPTSANMPYPSGGTGGGGGGSDGATTAGAGGNGALAAGGGGGAGNVSTNASGAGGAGGNGFVIIVEYL